MHIPLAASSDLGNLTFVVLAILAWVFKAAVDRKEAREAPAVDSPRRSGGPRRNGGGADAAEADATEGEVDVVYGRRKLPEALTAMPTPLGRGAQRPAGLAAALPTASAGALVSVGSSKRSSLSPEGSLGTLRARQGGDQVTAEASRPSARGWSRLGIARRVDRRAAVRAGVLWSEVLGPPRATAGPHRTPMQRRRERGL